MTRSRLAVLAGPTAVGKGTVAADVRAPPPRDLDLGVGDDARAAAGRAGRRPLLVRLRRGVRPDGRRRRAPRVGGGAQGRPLRHPAPARRAGAGRGPARHAGDRPPGRPPGAGDDARGAVRVPDAAVVGRAGPPAGRPGHRDRGGTGAPAGHGARGAGRRGGVRRDHREPRSSRCRGGVGSLDAVPRSPTADDRQRPPLYTL